MSRWPGLDEIALGEATHDEARAAIAALADGMTDAAAQAIHGALRAWTWKSLTNRRRGEDLLAWHHLLGGTAAAMSEHPMWRARMHVLRDLVHESIAVTESFASCEIASRAHVRVALAALLARGGRASRADLRDATGLDARGTTLLVNLMANADLIRSAPGAAADGFELTLTGLREAGRPGGDDPATTA